jgi:predicted transport protein
VSNLGHWGTGQVEIVLHDHKDLATAEGYIRSAYDDSTHAR